MKPKQFIAICSTESLPFIREFMEGELHALKLSEVISNQIVLAVDEACANLIIHQHNNDCVSEILISISRINNTLTMEIKDQGEPFPIDKYEPADLQQIIESGTKGGLGISLINKIMDKVEVLRHKDSFTYRFSKNLDPDLSE